MFAHHLPAATWWMCVCGTLPASPLPALGLRTRPPATHLCCSELRPPPLLPLMCPPVGATYPASWRGTTRPQLMLPLTSSSKQLPAAPSGAAPAVGMLIWTTACSNMPRPPHYQPTGSPGRLPSWRCPPGATRSAASTTTAATCACRSTHVLSCETAPPPCWRQRAGCLSRGSCGCLLPTCN